MKHFKQILSFLLTLSIALSPVLILHAAEAPTANVSLSLSDEGHAGMAGEDEADVASARQAEVLQEYFEIVETLSDEQLAGSYFDEDGKLHILVTEGVPVRSDNDGICFELAKYSYGQLQRFQEMINEYSEEIGFTASGIDQEDNQVVIYSIDDLDLDLLHEIIPEDSVKIVREDHTIAI